MGDLGVSGIRPKLGFGNTFSGISCDLSDVEPIFFKMNPTACSVSDPQRNIRVKYFSILCKSAVSSKSAFAGSICCLVRKAYSSTTALFKCHCEVAHDSCVTHRGVREPENVGSGWNENFSRDRDGFPRVSGFVSLGLTLPSVKIFYLVFRNIRKN